MSAVKQMSAPMTNDVVSKVVKITQNDFSVDHAMIVESLSMGRTPMMTYIIEDVKGMLNGLPKRPPAGFKKFLDGGNRVGGDLDTIFLRYWMALYLIGKWRLCASLEIDTVLAEVEGISSRSGSLKRILVDLVGAGMLVNQKLTIGSPQTVLTVTVRAKEE